MKSYDTGARDNTTIESSPEEGTEVEMSHAGAENIEEAGDVATSEVSVSEVVERDEGVEVDTYCLPSTPSDEQVAVEEDVSAQPGTYMPVLPASEDADKEIGGDEQPRRSLFSPPTRGQILEWLPFWGIILLAAILRFWGLGDKPLHHDESLHAYYALQLMKNDLQNWLSCFNNLGGGCYTYDPLLHGPFQFHAIALVYQISQWLHAPDNGVNTTTVRIAAATLGTVLVGLPYFVRDYLGRVGAILASFLLAVSPSMVYFSRFAREDIYLACFTLLLVVAVARYIRGRKMRWLVIAAAAFSLAYATAESTFLMIAIFGSFLGALVAWELGKRWPLRARVSTDVAYRNYLPETWGSGAVVLYFLIFLPIAKVGLGILDNLAIYVTNTSNTATADAYVQHLKNNTVMVVPWIGIILGIYVLIILVREMLGRIPPAGRRGLAKRVDPQQQPLLDSIVTMPWTHWFFAVLCAWAIFLILFTALFTNIRGGIGDGIWQGLYYWLQQQQVARGGQPWYYYLMLIPLYELIGVVFGLVGVVRSLLRPTRFRLFLVYWFLGNFFIFSWAAEKMPWLMILITLPMLLLAAIGLEPAVVKVGQLVRERLQRQETPALSEAETPEALAQPRPKTKAGWRVAAGAITICVLAIMLLVPTLQNMYQVTYVHSADGPHEMMIYVQTTTDIDIVMAKISALDQKMDGGHHTLAIGVMPFAGWPFYWYLRDYPNACFSFPNYCSEKNPAIIIGAQDDVALPSYTNNTQYLSQQYKLRSWWDEGYKPVPCVSTTANKQCAGQQTWGGVGPGLWLSYGDNPPPGAKFNLGLAVKNVWNWWWQRKAIGSTDGAYDIDLFVRKDSGIKP